jgi:hypothetical protein
VKVAGIFFLLKNWRWTDADVGDWMLNEAGAGVVILALGLLAISR